LRRLD